jgi:hypothetical protein
MMPSAPPVLRPRRRHAGNALALALVALVLLAPSSAFGQGGVLFGGTFTVLDPSVVIGERARVEVQVFGGADFPLQLDWGDGTIDVVSNHPQPNTVVLEHAYAGAGIKVLRLSEGSEDFGVETDVIEVRTPRLRLDAPSVAVGERLRAAVEAAPVAGAIDWGDGSRDPLGAGGDLDVEHTYGAAGTYVVQLEDAATNVLDVQVVTVASATGGLRLSSMAVLVGETVVAEVADAPAGATLAWGDGRRDPLGAGAARIEHAYTAAGAFVVRLVDASEALLALETVAVTPGPLRFEVPSFATVGLPLEVEVEGLGANAPFGAQVAWGDGRVEVVLGDGRSAHRYTRPGTFLVRMNALPSGAPLAASVVTVEATGRLAVEGEARLFEATTWIASELAPGYAYELELGDGAVRSGVADASGRLRVAHVYDAPVDGVDASLLLVEGGQRVLLDRVRADLALPAGREAIAATVLPRLTEGRLDLLVELDGLRPELDYVVAAPSVGLAAVAPDGDGRGRATFEVLAGADVDVELGLYARVERSGGGVVETLRAETTARVAWPRGAETLAVEFAATPLLVSDAVDVVAGGLVPGYAYELVVAGDAARPYRLGRADDTRWTVALPLDAFGPAFEVELRARYPMLTQFGPPETRTRLTLQPVTPGGSLALPAPVVPYGVPSPILVRELTPGLPYRVEIEGDVIARFDADAAGALDLEHPLVSTARIDLFVDRPFADVVPVASVAPSGITFAGALSYAFDTQTYLDSGTVTMQVRGAAAEVPHVIAFSDGRRFELTPDATGSADVVVESPGLEAFLRVRPFGDEFFVARARLDGLPPRTLSFHGWNGWLVRVQRLDAPFVAPASRASLSGVGVLEGLVIGGRLQDPIPLRFESLSVFQSGYVRAGFADLIEPWPAQLPQAVRGVTLTLSTLRLTTVGSEPDLRGSATLPWGEPQAFDRVMLPSRRPGDGFMVSLFATGAPRPLGGTGFEFVSGGFAVLDLSTEANYNLRRDDGRFAIDHAYDAYVEIGRPSPARERGAGWVGVLYTDARFQVRDASAAGVTSFAGDAAWTAAGISAYLRTPLGDGSGTLQLGGWTFRDVTGLELLVVDDQVLRFTRPSGTVRLDWFGQTVPVAFRPAWYGWTVHTLAPVAQDYGSTAVVGGVGAFVRTGPDRLSLRFPNALWALDGDLAAEPTTVDGSSGEGLLASLPDEVEISDDIRELYADSIATAETALNLYQLQLLLKDLTLHPDGSVDLGGAPWRTLARIPALDMFGFPYLGGGVEIGVQHDGGGTYRIGLRGDLKLGEVIEANAAPSWFVHRGGRQTQWRFEGVGVKFGDYEDSPVTFALVVGGVIDLEQRALSFTGGGSLTLPEVISVEAMALFGVVGHDTPDPDFFWFVGAGVDLGQMERPINVKVKGVDVMAFYVFRGGIASHLRIDVGGGDCRVDDGNLAEARLPSIAANALDCYDPDLKLSLQAGTVVGSPAPSGMPPDGYGKLWHLDADLVVNLGRGGDLQLAGKGWIGRNLDEGYRQRRLESEQLAGRLVINAAGIVGSMCAGPLASAAGVLDCSGLQPAEIRAGGFLIVDLKGAIEFKASWSTGQSYFALGTVRNPVSIYVVPRFTQGYFITGYVNDRGILHPAVRLPAGGAWVGAETGFRYDYEKSGDVKLCSYRVYAGADFGYGGALGLQVVPRFQIDAAVVIHASARAGGRVCGRGLDVSASLVARGALRAPNPTQFRGSMDVKIKLPVIPDIDVTVPNLRLELR